MALDKTNVPNRAARKAGVRHALKDRLAILIAIAEAKAAGDLRHIGRGKDREAQRPAE